VTATLVLAWTALLALGAWAQRPQARSARAGRAPTPGARGPGRRPTMPPARARLLRAAAGGVVAAVVALPLSPIVAGAIWAAPVLAARRGARRRAEQVLRDLPEIVDLVHVAVGAGLTVPLAVQAVAGRAEGPIADELRRALADVAMGARLADALGEVPTRAGEATRPLVAALVASDRYGAPLAEALARLAVEVRADRRRRAEEAARRVPVKLLFPLVCCVLPAFGLLTLAPLLAGAFSALRL
jgi:tight adherence protein C